MDEHPHKMSEIMKENVGTSAAESRGSPVVGGSTRGPLLRPRRVERDGWSDGARDGFRIGWETVEADNPEMWDNSSRTTSTP